MTTLKTKADVPDDFVMPEILYAKFVVDDATWRKTTAQSSMDNPQGDCREASMKLKVKLSGIGAVRVRGGISSKFIVGMVDENTPDYIEHFWVEAKGLVYDWSQGKNVIMKREVWYDLYKIQDSQTGTGVLGRFDDEKFGLTRKELIALDNTDPKVAVKLID
jgi:hypothetical protein